MSDKVELTELDEAAYGNQAAEFELHSMRLQIAELQVSLAVSQREAADWKQELEAYKATENARISELQADLAQARAEAKTNGDEAAAVRRLYGDAMVGIGELQARTERLEKRATQLADENHTLKSWQESTAVYLADADRALAVLFTMLTKVGLKEGAAVADETRAHVRAALKEVAHSKSTAQPLPGGMQRDKMPGECAPIWPPEPEKLPEKQQ